MSDSVEMKKKPEIADSFACATIDNVGGDIRLADGKVRLEVSKKALRKKELIALRVKPPPREAPIEKGECPITPSVRCTPSGIHFQQKVSLTLPHCVDIRHVTNDTRVILCTQGGNDITRI